MAATISITDTTNGRKVSGSVETAGMDVSIRLVMLRVLSGPRDVVITHTEAGRYIVSDAAGAQIARIDAEALYTQAVTTAMGTAPRRQDMATPKQMAYIHRLCGSATSELRSRVAEVTGWMRQPMTKAQASLAISRLTWGEDGDFLRPDWTQHHNTGAQHATH